MVWIEESPSNRAYCRLCHKPISKGEMRVAEHGTGYYYTPHYYHISCWIRHNKTFVEEIRKIKTETTKYVVVDENNRWLYYGEAQNPLEALGEAKLSNLYDRNADIYVFEVSFEIEYPAFVHASLKRSDIETTVKEKMQMASAKP